MNNLFCWALILALFGTPAMAAEDGADPAPEIEVAESWRQPFGWYLDTCQAPSPGEAMKTLAARIERDGGLTVAELLGPIEKVVITEIWQEVPEEHQRPEAAIATVRHWLESMAVSPTERHRRPQTYPYWAEGSVRYLDGFILYRQGSDCRRGRFELGYSPHFAARDSRGTVWWHYWDKGSMRRLEGEDPE